MAKLGHLVFGPTLNDIPTKNMNGLTNVVKVGAEYEN